MWWIQSKIETFKHFQTQLQKWRKQFENCWWICNRTENVSVYCETKLVKPDTKPWQIFYSFLPSFCMPNMLLDQQMSCVETLTVHSNLCPYQWVCTCTCHCLYRPSPDLHALSYLTPLWVKKLLSIHIHQDCLSGIPACAFSSGLTMSNGIMLWPVTTV